MKTTTINNLKAVLSRTGIVAVLATTLLPFGEAFAAQITNRTLTIGSSAPSAVTTHQNAFTVNTTANIGSIGFQYCTTASGACVLPTGLVTTSATLSAQSGAGTAFTIVNTTNGAPYITRTAASLAAASAVSFTFSNITNPSTTNTTFYVRITTYTSTTATAGATDTGTDAGSTANQINVTASVPETLTFCVYTGANCGAGGSSVALGSLSTAAAASGTSLMDVGTNASSGYTVTVNGTTLTSGANTIPAYSNSASVPGVSGFGINLRANTTPAVGADKTNGAAPSIGTYAANYGTANSFNYATGDAVATSAGPTNNNTFTVSYVANIGTAQAAGAYASTFTYICTASF
jgi:hypothetical protein